VTGCYSFSADGASDSENGSMRIDVLAQQLEYLHDRKVEDDDDWGQDSDASRARRGHALLLRKRPGVQRCTPGPGPCGLGERCNTGSPRFKVQAQFKSTTSKIHPGRSGVASRTSSQVQDSSKLCSGSDTSSSSYYTALPVPVASLVVYSAKRACQLSTT
jgi:hypothetical protein